MDFSKFDQQIDVNALKHDVEETKKNGGTTNFPEVPDGVYVVKIEKMEVGETGPNSTGGAGRPMLKVQFCIIEGEYAKSRLFYNRVLFGTKNDVGMIASAVALLESMEPSEDVGPVIFNGFNDFSDLVLDIAEDVESLEYEVEYEKGSFNSIVIKDVFG